MKITQYPSLSEILELHQRTIKVHGGTPGVCDLGLIESALYRPQSGYYETVYEQAAAIFQSFCMNHAFVDGNKRIALLAMVFFLRINGWRLVVENSVAVKFIVEEVIKKQADAKKIAKWIEQWVVKE